MYGLKVLRTCATGFPKTTRSARFYSRDARDFGGGPSSFTPDQGQSFPRLSVPLEPIVQVFNTSFAYNVFQPWQNNPHQMVTGTGFAISEKRIITNAHVIGYPGTLQVCKTNSTRKYSAKLVNLSNTIDLAILRVEDPEFWNGIQPFELSEDLAPQDTLQIAGYPSGGNNISIASGSVARFAMVPSLEAEVNIAVNPGNSGGPAFKGTKVAGVVYKQDTQRKVSFVIPSVCVNSYLDHVKKFGDHKQVDGGVLLQKLDNKAMREMYGMQPNESGVLVVYVIKNSSSEGVLFKNDVLLEAEGHAIADDGTISHPIYGRIHYSYLNAFKCPGDKFVYKILRDKQYKEVAVTLQEYKFSTPSLYRDKPAYFIYGGLVFTKLSAYYSSQFKQGLPAPLQTKIFQNAQTSEFDGQEFVVISEVLPHDVNLGYTGVRDLVVEKVNGVDVKNLKHFAELVENNRDEYLKLDVSQDYVVAFKRNEVEEANREISAAFNLTSHKSAVL